MFNTVFKHNPKQLLRRVFEYFFNMMIFSRCFNLLAE